MAKDARDVAVMALTAYRKQGVWPDVYLKSAVAGMDVRDAALATNITYGVMQNRMLLDFYIKSMSSIGMSRIAKRVLDILRVGLYQLYFLDKVPEYAVVDGAVRMARRENERISGFVNAVLRTACRMRDNLPEATDLATRYSHPQWLVSLLAETFGEEDAVKIMQSNNKIPSVYARVNTMRATTDEVLLQLMNCGAVADEKTDVPNCITIEHMGDVEKQTAFKNGNITICSKSSQLAAIAAGAASGDMVLDVCAAPGGKTIIMAQGMENSGAIIACDVSENKLSVIRKTAVRCGIKNIKTQCKDAREFDPTFEERFNVVLADVPCSGLGMIGRKPEIRYKDEEEIKGLPEIQMAILKNVAKYVIPGGVLVYSTCTILPRENEDIVNAFLAENKDFEACSFELPGIGAVPRDITLLPQLHGTDGFYMCKLRRKT